ncbi:integrin alpha-M-like, partial [Lepisosteus oculatus]|uniref:integrin alpha-M-like n=1 Tax=Lepisosteus oculatus TaxID=7918 RepID=UPI00371496EC
MGLLVAGLCLLTALCDSSAFNLETENVKVFEDQSQWFGYRVLQLSPGRDKWVIVSAPLERNGTLFKCDYKSGTCSRVIDSGPGTMGLSLTARQPDELVVCGPRLQHSCGKNEYLNGVCFTLDRSLNVLPSNYTPGYQECTSKPVDIVFLIDGSGSIERNEFSQMKVFMQEIINRFQGRGANFAVVQYSYYIRLEFDFNKYTSARSAADLINNIVQMGSSTRTAAGIKYVADTLFQSRTGARQDASRVLITITDGEATDENFFPFATQAADAKNIIRYAIGVGDAFQKSSARLELNTIASDEQFVFAVDNFDALGGIQKQLAEKIFAIEGTQQDTSVSSFQHEMSQGGFSSHFDSDGTLYFGAVGAFDWSGGFFEKTQGSLQFINMSSDNTDMKDSYMGYSITDLKVDSNVFIIVGAPRYQHKGRIVVFNKGYAIHSETGGQSGSYFGSSLCSLNLKRSNLVLVGAPTHVSPEREGMVFVFTFDRQKMMLHPSGSLTGESGQSSSRFGMSISELADLNGDGIQDVAVGAPLENGGQGSVYIFNGGDQGLNRYSQRIAASQLSVGLQYWGQSLHGAMDLSGDNIPDLAVGSLGKVLVLRSRPVIRVEATVTFSPKIIKQENENCQSRKQFKAHVCFTLTKVTKDSNDIQSTISYNLTLDKTRTRFRAYFTPKNRMANSSFTARLRTNCQDHTFYVPECTEDSLISLSNELEFSVTGLPSASKLKPILEFGTQPTRFFQLPFDRQCGTDNKCVDDLRVDFNFSGVPELQVGISPVLNLTVAVENRGEDSYNSRVIFTYPSVLSYRRNTLLQFDRRATVQCEGTAGEETSKLRNITCLISKPILKGGSRVVFLATFDVDSSSQQWSSEVTISANATSSNEEHATTQSFVNRTLPVKLGINVLVKNELDESTSYVNFSAGRNDLRRPVHHVVQVQATTEWSAP